MRWLIYGGKGWIGSYLVSHLKSLKEENILSDTKVDLENEVESEIVKYNPNRILSFIGRTYGGGYTSIDYLELKGK